MGIDDASIQEKKEAATATRAKTKKEENNTTFNRDNRKDPPPPPETKKKSTRLPSTITQDNDTIAGATPKQAEQNHLQNRLLAVSARLHQTVPKSMTGEPASNTTTDNAGGISAGWTDVPTKHPKPEARYTTVDLAPGDQIILCKGFSDAPAARAERLTIQSVAEIMSSLLCTHIMEVLGMLVKHASITDTDVPLSPAAAKRRQRNKPQPIVPDDVVLIEDAPVKVRAFAIHIGFFQSQNEVTLRDEQLLIEILDGILKKRLHHHLVVTSKWGPFLDFQLAPVKAPRPKPIAIIYGINPGTLGGDAVTCTEVNLAIFNERE
eukprot:scaffold30053_cov22-Attheya_sp.AAC.1